LSKLWMNIEWHVFMAHGVYNYTVLNCIVKKTCLWQNLKSGCAVYSVGKTKQTNVTYIQSFSHNTQLVHTSLGVARGTNHTQRNVLQVDMLWCECGVGQKCAAESNVVTSTGESLTCTVSLILPVTPSQSFLSCHSSSQSHRLSHFCLVTHPPSHTVSVISVLSLILPVTHCQLFSIKYKYKKMRFKHE